MEDYKKIQEMIDREKKNGAFVFMPSPILPMDKSYYMPLYEEVLLREDEIYKSKKQYRIHFNGLLRLSGAAKMKWSVDDTCRTDNRSDKLYCSFRAVGGVVEADGAIQFHKAEKDIDIEIIEMELTDQYKNGWEMVKNCTGNDAWKKHGHKKEDTFVAAMVRRDLIQARKNKLMNAESGAKARLIRGVLGIQSSYANKNQLIGMPFIMVYYVKNPSHPEVRKFLAASLSNSQNMIYGTNRNQGQIPYYDKDVIDIEPVDDTAPNDHDYDNDFQESSEPEPGFEPKQEKASNVLDFENCSVDDQIRVLQEMCRDNDEDYQHYEKTTKKDGGVRGMGQEWRNKFFNYLNDKKDGE